MSVGNDEYRAEFERFYWDQDIKPKRRWKQLVHKWARQIAKRLLNKELKTYVNTNTRTQEE